MNIFLAGFVPNQLFSVPHNSSQFFSIFSILLNFAGKVSTVSGRLCDTHTPHIKHSAGKVSTFFWRAL